MPTEGPPPTDLYVVSLSNGADVVLDFAQIRDRKYVQDEFAQQLGHVIPDYSDEQWDEVVAVMMRAAGYEVV